MTDTEYSTAIKHLNYFEDNIPGALFQFQNSTPNSAQWFTLGMLQRLLNISVAIKTLLPEYLKKSVYDFSLGIILRPVILDALIGLNLYSLLRKGLAEKLENQNLIEKVDSFCNAMLADGLVHTLRYFKQMEANQLTGVNKLIEMYNHFTVKYSEFLIQLDGINTMPRPKHKIDSRANIQFENLANDQSMKKIGHRLYDLYTIYSKYDHFGFISFELLDSEKGIKSDRISATISLFVNHFANLCNILQRVTPNDKVINDIFLSSKEYLSNKHSA
ncbi:MAG: hypothetical protein ABIU77_07735 [Ferruginibacter sp.]